MEAMKLILNQPITKPALLDVQKTTDGLHDADKKEEYSKKFEAVFIQRLFEEMKNTVVNWDEEKDGTSQQIDGLFWMKLAEGIADKGGFGMWKDIYQHFTKLEQADSAAGLLDKNL